MNLKVDPKRLRFNEEEPGSVEIGIPIRAQDPDGKYGTFDLALLDTESLKMFLASKPRCAENVVGIILGHGNLYENFDRPPVYHLREDDGEET